MIIFAEATLQLPNFVVQLKECIDNLKQILPGKIDFHLLLLGFVLPVRISLLPVFKKKKEKGRRLRQCSNDALFL
jgi:hypothetical protein